MIKPHHDHTQYRFVLSSKRLILQDTVLFGHQERRMTEAAQAAQLDSVTDRVKETELDASKAQQAMSALSTTNNEGDAKAAALASVAVSKEDVALIVAEMEVTEEVAERVLREVASELKEGNVLEEALRKLVTSQ
mmetsp:Transcript_128068/g.190841  ORF Transcript_128068/g.190841 Transcript_128068/m.190841 type:complete len:135 (-) Transcript_128068:1575-1979(-)